MDTVKPADASSSSGRLSILVCVKQVPGTTQVEVDEATGVLKRDGVEGKLNPYDLYALEAALGIKDALGAEITVLTMGPNQARAVLLESVYMGADNGVLVSDRRFAGADVLATAYTLSQAVRRVGRPDLIFCGKQTTDGDTAQVGAELAEFLQLPHTSGVRDITLENNEAVVICAQDNRTVTQRMPTPCLLCMDGGVNTPRLPSYRTKRALLKDPVTVLTLDDFADTDANHYGLSGSPTQVEQIFPPEKNDVKQMYTGSGNELAEDLLVILKAGKYI